MEENDQTNMTASKPGITVKKVLRVLLLLCIVFTFCPSFLVSCSGQNVNVSVMTAVGGVSAYGEKIVDPYPIMLICLLIPVGMLVLLFVKKFADKKTAGIILGGAVVDFIIWFIFRSSVKRIAEENYCTFKTTVWFVFNIAALLLIIVLSALVVLRKMQMDSDIISAFTGGGTQRALNQMTSAVTQMSGAVSQMAGNVMSNMGSKAAQRDAIGFCSKCGSPIAYGCRFCTSCGTPVPESMIAEAEAAKQAAEEAEAAGKSGEEQTGLAAEETKRNEEEHKATETAQAAQVTHNDAEKAVFCQQCGAKLDSEAVFCESCGTKAE